MSEPVAVARQATFETEPADSETVSGSSIRRGNIVIPVVEEVAPEISDQHRLSLASSGRSSPIYVHGDPDIKKYRTTNFQSRPPRCTKPPKPPSYYGDSSELEILSDVGLAGDSDTDATPPSLSLSARKKLKKEPRIKVPSSKFDSGEPTIEEETTQEILIAAASKLSETDTDIIPEVSAGIRSETIVVESPRKRKSVSFNLAPDASVQGSEDIQKKQQGTDSSSVTPRSNKKPGQSPRNKVEAESKPDRTNSNSKVTRSPSPSTSQADEVETLDSSFCESDWQPKPGDERDIVKSPRSNSKDTYDESKPRTRSGENVTPRHPTSDQYANNNRGRPYPVEEDKKVISEKYETDVKPVHNARLDVGKRWAPSKTEITKAKGTDGHVNDSVTEALDVEETETLSTGATLSLPRTPVISSFADGDFGAETDASAFSDWNNDSVSGIPKQGRLSKENQRREKLKNLAAEYPNSVSSPIISPIMDSSDAFGYESETFEEVLKERNAMVKAERTYQRRIKQLEDELKGMVNQCQMLSDENKELRKSLENMKKSKVAVEANNSGDSVDLAARIARLETEKENLSNSNEKMTQKVKENETKMKQWDSVFVENTKLKTKNAELEKKIVGLERNVDALSSKARESDVENESRIQGFDTKNQELVAKMNELQYENRGMAAKVKSLEKDNEELSTSLEEKRKELNEVLRAMQNETSTETDLKESKAKLERAQEEMDSVKDELEDMKKMLKVADENKAKIQGYLAQRDGELKRVKQDMEHKDNVIGDLRKIVDKSRQEIQRLEESQQASKDMERDTLALKSRIGSLKAEIESSLAENQRLKIDREEMTQQLERLRQENSNTADAVLESKKYFRKWENERDLRNKAEVEVAKKEDEIQILDGRLKEAGNKINVLYSKLKALEDEKAQLGSANMQELSTNNKILKDENKKLRQMLVERNIELTNKKSEQTVIDSKIRILERKQKDAEVRVRQLSGWVGDVHTDRSTVSHSERVDASSSQPNKPPRPPNNVQSKNAPRPNEQHPPLRNRSEKSQQVLEPQIAYVSPRSRKAGVKRNNHSSLTPPPGWEESRKERDGDTASNHTPLSLPLILDTKSITPPDPHGGYFTLYKEKMKRMRERRY